MHTDQRTTARRIGGLITTTVLAAVTAVLAASVCIATLLVENQHADNLYNLGLVRRSIESAPPPLLETSYVHWFFERYPQIRPEDWHRSAPLVGIVVLGKLLGTTRELALRSLHLAWTTLWLAVVWWLSIRSVRQLLPGDARPLPILWAVAVAASLIVLTVSPGVQLATGALMDDVPAGVCVLLGFAALLGPRPTRKRTIAAGIFFGLAFCMKDMALMWAPVGLVATLVICAEEGRGRRSLCILPTVFALAWLATAGLKLAWNTHEIGRPLPQEASLGMQGRALRGVPVGEHQFFYLDDDLSAAAGGLLGAGFRGLAGRISFAARLTIGAGRRLGMMWAWIAVAVVGCLLPDRRSSVALRLLWMLGLSLAALAGVFLLHLAEPYQLRYWIVPLSLAGVLGSAGVTGLIVRATHARCRLLSVTAAAVVATILLLLPLTTIDGQLASVQGREAYHPSAESAALAFAEPGAVLLQTTRGMQLWANNPQANVVGVSYSAVASLEPASLQQLVDDYDVRSAIVSRRTVAGRFTAKKLESVGFRVARSWGPDALLVRQVAPSGRPELKEG